MKRWRLVCHSCGEKYPEGTAIPCKPDCCKEPQIHIHDVDQPCERCEDPAVRKIVDEHNSSFVTRRLTELVLEKGKVE